MGRKSVFGYFKTKKKVPMAIKLGGGGKALMAWPLVEELFFAASLTEHLFSFDPTTS